MRNKNGFVGIFVHKYNKDYIRNSIDDSSKVKIFSDDPFVIERLKLDFPQLGVYNIFDSHEGNYYKKLYKPILNEINIFREIIFPLDKIINLNISDHIDYFLCNSNLFTYLKYASIIDSIIMEEGFSKIILDSFFSKISSYSSNISKKQRKNLSFNARIKLIKNCFLAITFQLFYKFLFSILLKRKKMKTSQDYQNIIIGETDMIYHYFNNMSDKLFEDEKTVFLSLISRFVVSKRKISVNNKLKVFEFYSKVMLKDLFKIFRLSVKYYFVLYRCLIRKYGENHYNESTMFCSIKLIQQLPNALLCSNIAEQIMTGRKPSNIFFANTNNLPICVMNELFQKSKIKTYSYTHGLVENPYGYLSNTDYMYVQTKEDAEILKQYNKRSKFYIYSINSSNSGSNKKKNHVIILSTSFVWHSFTNFRFLFLKECLEFVIKAGLAERNISVYIKPHPYDNINIIKKELRFIKQNYIGKSIDVSLINGEISDIMISYDEQNSIWLTMYSTIIAQLNLSQWNYFIYDSIDSDFGNYYATIPNNKKFKTSDELLSKFEVF